MLPYIVVIVVGSIAWRGALSIIHRLIYDPLNVPLAYHEEGFLRKAVLIYSFAAPLAAAVNGYALGGLAGLFIVLVMTWVGMQLTNIFLRFNPSLQFIVFGFLNVLITLFLLSRLCARILVGS